MSKQIVAKNSATQALKTGQKTVVKIANGQHLTVQDLVQNQAKHASDVVVTKQGQNLHLKFADGTELEFDGFYNECGGNVCSVTVAGQEAGGYAINGDTAVGAATSDGGHLVYACGDHATLMSMASADAGMSGALGSLGDGLVAYVPAEGVGMGALAALGGALGLAGAGGGGGGAGGAIVTPIINTWLSGSFVAGPVVNGHGLVATAYDANGNVIGTATLEADGSFSVNVGDYTGVVIVRVTDTTAGADYWDEATGAPKDLTVDLRAVTYVAAGGAVQVNVNVFTETAVRELGVSGVDLAGVTAEEVAAANKKLTDALGLTEDLVTGTAPIAVVTDTGAENTAANAYGKLLAAASGVDESGSTEATVVALQDAVNAANPVLSTSVLLLNGAANVVDKVPSFLTEAQMSLNDYFFIADSINALRDELAGTLATGDYSTIKALSNQIKIVSDSIGALQSAIGTGDATLSAALSAAQTALQAAIDAVSADLSAAVADLQAQIDANGTDIATNATDIAALQTALTTLQTLVDSNDAAQSAALSDAQTALQAAIDTVAADLSAAVTDLQSQIDANGTDIAGNATDIAALQMALTNLQASVASGSTEAQAALSTVETALQAAIDAVSAALSAAVTDLQAQIDTNASDIAGNATDIAALQTALTTLQGVVDSNDTAQSAALSTAVADLQAQIDTNGTDIATNATDIAALQTALTTLQALVDSNDTAQSAALSTAQTSLQAAIDAVASELSAAVTDLQTQVTANGGDIATNAAGIAALISDAQGTEGQVGYVAPTTDSIAGLKAALDALSTTGSTSVAALEAEIGAPADGNVAATGLYLVIENAVSAAVTSLTADIDALRTEVEGTGYNTATYQTIADLSTALTALQALVGETSVSAQIADAIGAPSDASSTPPVAATGLFVQVEALITAEVGTLNASIADLQTQITANDGDIASIIDDAAANNGTATTNSIAGLKAALDALGGTGTDVTALQSSVSALETAVADLQAQIDAIVKPDLIVANELDNHVELYAYENHSTFIRAELKEGDDTLNGFSGDTQIVGGQGADVINLTYRDNSQDKVIYQDVEDGRTVNVVEVAFSTTDTDYREGAVLTLTVNGSEYSYTVSTSGGETMAQALVGLAGAIETNAVSAVAVLDNAIVLYSQPGATLAVAAGGDTEASIDNPGLATQLVVNFSTTAGDWPTPTNTGHTTEFDRALSVTITAGSEPVTVSAAVVYVDGVADQAASVAALASAVNGTQGFVSPPPRRPMP